MNREEVLQKLENQRVFFASGKTQNISYRLKVLRKMKSLILEYEPEIIKAIGEDFGKPEFEVIATETRFVIQELNLMIRKLRKWARPERVRTPLIHFISASRIEPQPRGQVLVLSPWNYPFHITILPVLSAIAAGNCLAVRVSRQVPKTAEVIQKIIDHFPQELVVMIGGDHSLTDYLLEYKFDYIFFTGSPKVGRHVMEKAAMNLTPVSLELGGKNPCVVTADANLSLAAKRITWGKFINAGQTCIGPDYLLVDKRVHDQFLIYAKENIKKFYGDDPETSPDLARVISKEAVLRLSSYIEGADICTGGKTDPEKCYVEPTILINVKTDDPVMQEEIFGPVLPVIAYDNPEKIYSVIAENPKPLVAYIFSENRKTIREFLTRVQSGNAAVNETIMQIATPYLPFGGVGPSGMGRYHGKKSFETFSNMRSVLYKSTIVDVPLRYAPYNEFKLKLVRLFLK